MNPYASYLGDKDPVKVIEATPRRLAEVAAALGQEERERKPAPGKWSPREILCHLADCEVVFAFRLRQAMAEDHHEALRFTEVTVHKKFFKSVPEAPVRRRAVKAESRSTQSRAA